MVGEEIKGYRMVLLFKKKLRNIFLERRSVRMKIRSSSVIYPSMHFLLRLDLFKALMF